jgi:hypothetical protein
MLGDEYQIRGPSNKLAEYGIVFFPPHPLVWYAFSQPCAYCRRLSRSVSSRLAIRFLGRQTIHVGNGVKDGFYPGILGGVFGMEWMASPDRTAGGCDKNLLGGVVLCVRTFRVDVCLAMLCAALGGGRLWLLVWPMFRRIGIVGLVPASPFKFERGDEIRAGYLFGYYQ